MPIIAREAIVRYSPETMFLLINDVASYPQFLPWCQNCDIALETPQEMQATITIAKGMAKQSFTTHNTLVAPTEINMRLVDGPFKHLEGSWQLKALSTGTQIRLHLDFEFSSRLLNSSFGPVFKQACEKMISAFVERAKKLYGN